MNEIEALREGLKWVRQEWIGRANHWSGELQELVGCCINEITAIQIKNIFNAIQNGEPIDIGGFIINGEKVTVYKSDNI